jgi:RNA-binding protein YhbY
MMKKSIVEIQIGKNGLTSEFIEQVRKIMETKRALKIHFLRASTRDKDEAKKMADALVSSLGSNFRYSLIGWTIVVKKSRKIAQ